MNLSLLAQQEVIMHFNRQLIQSQSTNPGIFSKHKAVVGLPSAMFNYGNSAFAYSDLFSEDPDSDSLVLNLNNVIWRLNDENIIQLHGQVDLLSVYFTLNSWNFNVAISERYNLMLTYPKNLVELAWNGNAQFVGQTIEIGPAVEGSVYKELSLNVGRRFKNLDFGVRMGLLDGIANVSSTRTRLTLTTDQANYASTLSTDYVVRVSNWDHINLDILGPIRSIENPGMSFSFGGVYHQGESWDLSASLLDLGFINWKKDVTTYTSKGDFTYAGVDVNDFFNDGEYNFNQYEDSIKELYFKEEEGGSYTSALIPKMYLSWLYHLDERTDVGAMVHLQFFNGAKPTIGVYGGRKFFDFLNVGLSYAYKNKRFDNIGLSLSAVAAKKLTVYMTTDNMFTLFRMGHSRNANIRIGINFNIGWEKGVEVSGDEEET